MNVGSPHDSVQEINTQSRDYPPYLFRHKGFTDDEYVQLLGDIRKDINPLLDKLSLSNLGSVPCPEFVTFESGSGFDVETPRSGIARGSPRYNLDLHRIEEVERWPGIYFLRTQRPSTRKLLQISIHGLFRNGQWMTARVDHHYPTGDVEDRCEIRIHTIEVTSYRNDVDFLRELVHLHIDYRSQILIMVDAFHKKIREEKERRQKLVETLDSIEIRLQTYTRVLCHLR